MGDSLTSSRSNRTSNRATTMTALKETERRNYYLTAYRIADEAQEDVYIVWQPPRGMSYDQNIPYIIFVSQADDYESEHGELVNWRRS